MDLSIIITTFNYEKYIDDCIQSCINQNNHNLNYEILIVDDGSTDNTHKILKSYQSHNIIRFFKIKNSGIEKASNFGFNMAGGKYLVRVDADDMLLPNYISSIESSICQNADFIYTNYSTINSNHKIIKNNSKLPDFEVEEILTRGDFLATGTAYRKDLIELFKGYNEEVTNSGLENYEFIINIIKNGYNGILVDEVSFLYRRHDSNISEIKRDTIIKNGKKLFKKLKLKEFTTNKNHPYGLKVKR